jgi:hypothetical protein
MSRQSACSAELAHIRFDLTVPWSGSDDAERGRLVGQGQRPCGGWAHLEGCVAFRKAEIRRSNRVGCARKACAESAGTVAGKSPSWDRLLVVRPMAIRKRFKGKSSALPTGFSETVEHMGVLFWPKPGRAFPDLKVERVRRNREGLFQCRLCLCGPAKFAQGGGEPAIWRWKVGK